MNKGGLRRKYQLSTLVLLLILVPIIFGTYLFLHNKWENLSNERQISYEKAIAMDDLSRSVNDLFLRARGYYAFKIDAELDAAYEEMGNIREAILHLRSGELTEEERELIDEIEGFLIHYENVTLPYATSLVHSDDYAGLRELSLGGTNDTVNQLIEYSEQYNDKLNDSLLSMFGKLTKQLNLFYLYILVGGAVLLFVIFWIVRRVIYDIIRPIEQIKWAADRYRDGLDFNFKPIERTDEIGALSDSFAGMIRTIQTKEDELTAQNEELLSQQEELVDKQSRMEMALSSARFAKYRLERYNGLNHQLSFSLDKQEILDLVLEYFDELYKLDLGGVWLPESGEYSLKGLSEERFDRFKQKQFEYIRHRLEKEPYFVVKREADYEKGITNDQTYVYDYFAGIKEHSTQLGITVAFSRIGRPFSEEDLLDMYGLLKRVELAIDRVEQYEKVNRERLLSQNILDTINEGIRFVSVNGEQDRYNQALFRLLEFPKEFEKEGIDREIWLNHVLDKVEDSGELKAFLEEALESDAVSQTSYKIPGDHPKVMNVYSVPIIIENERSGTIFVHRDITQEYEIDRMKTELVSTVSHELRTPLSSVLGFTELLLSKEMDAKRQKRYLETIHKEAQRLTNLINDFLDLQRMESGQQSYQMIDVNLSEVAKEVMDTFQVDDHHSIAIVDKAIQPIIMADHDKMVQVFTNLLSNALKFSPDGGNVLITIATEEDRAIVSIEDEGIGIPANQIGKMFEKFQRFDNSYSRKIGGTGLGLAICREIVENHGGKIWIESEEGVGTAVFFALPLQTVAKTELLSSNSPAVMIVEDDSSIALLLGEELKMIGFSVIHQSKVNPAFTYAKEEQPNCIVVDLLLGEKQTGWDLIRRLKEDPATQHIPIVISSALEKREDLVSQFNVDHYMTKPYPLHELSGTIEQALQKRNGLILYPDGPLAIE
ncbi:ATP-binding protein [Sporosarcina sp. 179-K 3D1 HS]|uniref:ATP-binding protein n=1 Tax=Sporosarcina sp. 179-K 3D1 HS TaxID=3232169 RepID=UPI0039A37FCE